MTSLCYKESQVGRVLLLLGLLIESIEFYEKEFRRPRVFTEKVFSEVESKFGNAMCVNLTSAILGIR